MNKEIIQNKYSFYEIKNKPSLSELRKYYSKHYFQSDKGNYQKKYSDEEIKYIYNKIQQKYYLFKHKLKEDRKKTKSLLDVGCGEGFAINFFHKNGWNTTGIDYSTSGIRQHNPNCEKFLLTGDLTDIIENLVRDKKKYNLIWLDNVLEHVLDPLALLKNVFNLATKGGVLVIEVPNDFSSLQNYLYSNGIINKQYWIAVPDHISYFNKDGLINICKASKWKYYRIISDFPIDFNLANKSANYYRNNKIGKYAHMQRILLDNLFHSISISKTNKLYSCLADMGLGRQIIGVFIKN